MAARGVNKVILVGHLGQDPEVRYMPNGGAVANLTLATSETWRDKQSGELHENTEWHRVVMFGKLAEVAGEYLRKGAQGLRLRAKEAPDLEMLSRPNVAQLFLPSSLRSSFDTPNKSARSTSKSSMRR